MTSLEIQLINKAKEYQVLVNEASRLIYEYRAGKISDDACWPTIRKRNEAKNELFEAIEEAYDEKPHVDLLRCQACRSTDIQIVTHASGKYLDSHQCKKCGFVNE